MSKDERSGGKADGPGFVPHPGAVPAERHLAGQYPVARQKKTQRFRSTLELIQLMDSALDSRGPDEKAFAAWDDSDAGTVPAQKQEEKENA